jgi:isopenicillin-N epimerase
MDLKKQMNINLNDDYAAQWDFRRALHFNHGSFGATPRRILERKFEILKRFNEDRDDFLWGDGRNKSVLSDIAEAKKPLASFIGAQPQDIVYVDNVTDAFNSVFKSIDLGKGDEVLVTNHIYANFPPPLAEMAKRQGFKIVTVDVPYPPRDDDQIVESILSGVTDRTKLAFIDHITAPTALIFPVKRIVAALKEKGVDSFIDGAHVPGQIPLNVDDIGAAYYAGNHHKWLCVPTGTGFLHVRRDRQDMIMPAVGSGGANRETPFEDRFLWRGTKDVSSHLLVPETIDFMAGLHPKGWAGIYERNHELALAARDILTAKLGIEKPCPDHMVGSMFTLPLGRLDMPQNLEKEFGCNRLRVAMIERHGFGPYATEFEGQYLMRVSAHLYNNLDQYRQLADALEPMVRELAPKPPARGADGQKPIA